MRDLTLILPYFCNAGMLEEQFRVWTSYPSELRRRLHVIVVDDYSPRAARFSAKLVPADHGLGSFRAFQTRLKVRWNWIFARNLGVHHAKTEWVLLTDIDHAMPADTFARLASGELFAENVYRLARVDAPHRWPFTRMDCAVRENKRYHPNTWIMTRAMYDAIGGYDERLSGCYGTDGEFRDRVQATARSVVMLPDVMIRYGREILPDASTPPHVYTRKNDPQNEDDLRRRRLERSQIPHWRPVRLSFPYREIPIPVMQEVG